jgi:hypothetical protein
MSGVFARAVELNLASYADGKIPDIRIELHSKRSPGAREDGVLPRNLVPLAAGQIIALVIAVIRAYGCAAAGRVRDSDLPGQ